MKKKFKMEEIDCANCAAKMEDAIKKIPGVENAVLSFMTQKLTIEADEADMDRILDEAQKACNKIEPDVKIIRK
ncbi:MAG: cation transporter [Eubacteriaceae bacterium]|jgi:copper chaperone CopZ